MKRAALLLLSLLASCAPDFREPARVLGRDVPPPREPIFERRTAWYDAECTRPRREWHVLILYDNSVLLHGRDAQYFADGKLEYEREYDHGELTGHWRSFWPGGTPRMEAEYGTDEPRLMRWWHENGQLSSEGPALNGIKTGEWKFWHASGALAAQGEYESGDREGEWSFWNADGSLKERGEFHDGARVGPWTRLPPQ